MSNGALSDAPMPSDKNRIWCPRRKRMISASEPGFQRREQKMQRRRERRRERIHQKRGES